MAHNVDVLRRLGRCRNWRAVIVGQSLGMLATFAMLSPAMAYPDRAIRMIIPLPPGGVVDIVARLLQPHLEAALGQPVIVENRAGASGIIGANTVATADPDGHTLLLVPTTFTINPAIPANRPFDLVRGFEPVALVARNSLIFLINPALKASTLKEFVDLAKAQPGKLNYATPGASSQAQLLLALWTSQAGLRMHPEPYTVASPAV